MSRSSSSVPRVDLIDKEISEMTEEQYSFIRYWIYQKAGIELGDLKKGHVQGRLGKRLRQINVWSWSDYIRILKDSHALEEQKIAVNLLTTNKTEFFREPEHFYFLKDHYLKVLESEKRTHYFWCAACSKGQESYTLAMVLEKLLMSSNQKWDYRILGTDINTSVVTKASEGLYSIEEVQSSISNESLIQYFQKGTGANDGLYRVKDRLRQKVKFRVHNLLVPLETHGLQFDVVFLRNVLIYFDKETIVKVVAHIMKRMNPGALLFIGHSENLPEINGLEYLGRAIYRKKEVEARVSELKKTKVFIIDDSPVFRKFFQKILESSSDLEVIGFASDPKEALEKLKTLKPNVVTLDIHMPKMTGVEFLNKYRIQDRIPVVVVSALSLNEGDSVLGALEMGAVDFIQKPQGTDFNNIKNEIQDKIRTAALTRVHSVPERDAHKNSSETTKSIQAYSSDLTKSLVVIGASTGGTNALPDLLELLPDNIPPILVVQHIPKEFSGPFAKRLNGKFAFEVKEAAQNDEILPNRVLIAPGDCHMEVRRVGSSLFVHLNQEEPVNRHRPSVDVLFRSVKQIVKQTAHEKRDIIGILLTGMGADGAQGLLELRNEGAHTIAQDEKSCVVFGMPKAAIDLGAAEVVSSLTSIPGVLRKWI